MAKSRRDAMWLSFAAGGIRALARRASNMLKRPVKMPSKHCSSPNARESLLGLPGVMVRAV
jgi:hypothetical protein